MGYSALSRGSVRVPRRGSGLAQIAAPVHDSQDEHALGLHAVHHPIALHDDFADGGVVGFRHGAATERKIPEPIRGLEVSAERTKFSKFRGQVFYL